ncbi:MAG: 30S ribosomal protein S21 [Spirochaetia bacterium]|nr:30S ribosomal protein S21 [Spirochaetota bacterium]MCX8096399.1 30S ribosomal protein S21 [Spirochaetota bacterium]MDW8112706.1 30S ribosomal protein S21 [Spirochaetia bacterium]
MALVVEIRDGDNVEFALKKFKRFVEMEGILSEYKAHLRYKKPSEERKEKLAAMKKKLRRLQGTKDKKK